MREYTVQSGDSLWKIVQNNYEGLSNAQISAKIDKIAAKNNIQDASQIMTGQTIKLPNIAAENELVEIDFKDEKENNIKKQKIKQGSEKHSNGIDKSNKLQKNIKDNEPLKTKIKKLQNDKPEPILDKNGNVVAKLEYFESDKEGSLSGVTVMVNPGHGGQNTVDGPFDCGAIEQSSGYQEWAINETYSEELVEKILDAGGDVALVQGTVDKVPDAIADFAQKYGNEDKSNLKFVSLHCNITDDASTSANGIDYYYNSTNSSNKFSDKLAQAAKDEGLNVRNSSQLQLKVCRVAEECGIDSTLIEMGFMNNEDDLSKLINNNKFQNKLLNSIVNGLG